MKWDRMCLKMLKQIIDDFNDYYWVVCAWSDGMGWDGIGHGFLYPCDGIGNQQ